MAINATRLRANLYKVLDRVLETGEPVEIERNGRILEIAPAAPRTKLDRLVSRPSYIVGDPAGLVHIDWSHEWKP